MQREFKMNIKERSQQELINDYLFYYEYTSDNTHFMSESDEATAVKLLAFIWNLLTEESRTEVNKIQEKMNNA